MQKIKMAPTSMVLIVIAAATLSAAFAAPKAEPCPQGCKCYDYWSHWFNCSYVDYNKPPSGPWPDVDTLWFAGNNVSEIETDFFVGFPSLQQIYLDENHLRVLDLDAFAGVTNLQKLRIRDNFIEEILPLPKGIELTKVTEIDLVNNSILAIDPDIFLPFPTLTTLYLNDNPLVVLQGRPLLSHPQLRYLYIARTNGYAISPETFQLTPNLNELSLTASRVPRLAGAFKALTSLTYLYLQDNLLTSVNAGELPLGQGLRWLDVSRNPVTNFEPAALDGVMKAGYLYITDTPLACACLYEDLYHWAKADKTWLTAYCGGAERCEFSATDARYDSV